MFRPTLSSKLRMAIKTSDPAPPRTTSSSMIAGRPPAAQPQKMPLLLKLLQISVISAQDLAPVSKLLRTYAVAWIHPNRKFKTRVDRQGHTNPTWNDKFVFCVDEEFLNNMDDSSSAVTIEIYTLSWLRDIPIGNVRLVVNDLIPPSASCRFKKKSSTRIVALQIRCPSGRLQGTLNVGINLLDSTMPPALSPELITSGSSSHGHHQKEKLQLKDEKLVLQRSQSEGSMSMSERINGSLCSYMRPLPSEVAATLAKGLYSTTSVGSSIFEGWTVAGDSDDQPPKLKAVRWTDDHTSMYDPKLLPKRDSHGGPGLLSCFGIACGYECNIVCGKPKSNQKIRKKGFAKRNVHDTHSDE